jgi:steroid 5-alpha reductase family enzyme
MNGFSRKIMPFYLIGMWYTFYALYGNGTFGSLQLIFAAISYALGLLVFRNFVYIFTYTYSLAVMFINMILLATQQPDAAATVLCVAAILYGARLSLFVWQRSDRDTYAGNRDRVWAAHNSMPGFVKVILWLFSSCLFLFVGLTCWFVVNAHASNTVTWIGAILMMAGFLMEAIADYQKQQYKLLNGNRICTVGLYTRIRYPNYLGEMIFHFGLYLAAVSIFSEPMQYIAGLFGPLWVFFLMIGQAVAGEKLKKEKYAEMPEYQAYVNRSSVLIPGIY